MMRLSKVLIAAAATIAVPVHSAFAQGEGEAAPAEEGTPPAEDATGTPPPDGSAPAVEAAAPGAWPSSIIDRPLVLMKGKLGAHVDLLIAHASITILGMTSSSTSEALVLGAGYGVTDKITAGASYGFTLNEFEIKGPLTVYGDMSLTDNGKLAVAASADLTADLGGQTVDSMGVASSSTELSIHAGLAVRYKLAPKMAVYTGNPYTPGPSGQHLNLGLSDGMAKTFSIPVGFAFQATPQLYAFAGTNIATILLSDPGMGSRVVSYGDTIPFNVGGFFNINKNIDAGASFQTDFKGVGDFYVITVGARYYN